MIDTAEVRKYWRNNIALICPGALNEIDDLCDELDRLRQPPEIEGLERPDIEEFLLMADVTDGGLSRQGGERFAAYILALEAEVKRLRADLRTVIGIVNKCLDDCDSRYDDASNRVREIEARLGRDIATKWGKKNA